VFAETYPDAEVIMMGVEEPAALIHAPNERAQLPLRQTIAF